MVIFRIGAQILDTIIIKGTVFVAETALYMVSWSASTAWRWYWPPGLTDQQYLRLEIHELRSELHKLSNKSHNQQLARIKTLERNNSPYSAHTDFADSQISTNRLQILPSCSDASNTVDWYNVPETANTDSRLSVKYELDGYSHNNGYTVISKEC